MSTAAPTIHLHSTNLLDSTADISVNGVRRRYKFMTNAEIDTLGFLFWKASGLKALNYAKKHAESTTELEDV